MDKLTKAANFFRLLDSTGSLSLTNLAVMIVLVKLALCTQCDMASVATLLTVIGSYHYKRYLGHKKSPTLTANDTLVKLQDEISKIQLRLGFTRNEKLPNR